MNGKGLVHIVDDDESLRVSLVDVLVAAGYEARTYASTGEFLLHPLPDRRSCVLLDVRMPGPSGIELQTALAERGIVVPIVFMTGHADVPTTVRAMKGGAIDFLEKPVAREALFEAIELALTHDDARRAAISKAQQGAARLATLTPREREVFDRIVEGRLNKQIADELGISLRTVKGYRAQIMDKLGARSSAELGKFANPAPD